MKAVFIDYSGTISQESGPDIEQVIFRCCKNSDIKDPLQLTAYWWQRLKEFETASYLETFMTEDEIVDKLLEELAKEYHLQENLSELHKLFQNFWMYAPIFEDVKEFFEKCPLPIYIVTNNGIQYIQVCMDRSGLKPAGIICGDMAKAYKPHRELFDKALEISGCHPQEVIHIGDSLSSDVAGAKNAGILPVLLDRKGKASFDDGTIVIRSLPELLNGKILSL
ncbi:MAG TPA: HAD family hydrolase [Candidatus Choladousia intestinigallinarum]|nr:HAD family hydrolase [Candidatus Choladousia intestinigallinarum]